MSMTTGDKVNSRFFGMGLSAMALFALLFLASYETALHAQTIQIKLVDGKPGRPVAGV